MQNPENHGFLSGVRTIRNYCFCFLLFLGFLLIFFFADFGTIGLGDEDYSLYSMRYDVEHLPMTEAGMTIRYGQQLFANTAHLLGKQNTKEPYVGNVLSCTNCHLDNGTRAYSIPLIGVDKRFPQYRAREDKIGNLQERINGCFERSMNGRKLAQDSQEMKALVAYIGWLGRYVLPNEKINGRGLKPLILPNRAVDLAHGKAIYQKHCTLCHGKNGEGQKNGLGSYDYPPVWGENSYNNGAGMTRVITAAQFIKYNMPYGVTHDSPVLTNEEAYDVAGYINQQQRPLKNSLVLDFPNRLKKPVSSPYPPYSDPFSQKQHQLGPFQPIMDYYTREYSISKSK
ncbi:MAG: c-type cytochrome [Flavobacteriaceae bacterium]